MDVTIPHPADEAVELAQRHVVAALDMRTAATPSLYRRPTADLLERVEAALGTLAAELAAHGPTPLALAGARRLGGVLAGVRAEVPAGVALRLRFACDALGEIEAADPRPTRLEEDEAFATLVDEVDYRNDRELRRLREAEGDR